jgi:hypothetical protein
MSFNALAVGNFTYAQPRNIAKHSNTADVVFTVFIVKLACVNISQNLHIKAAVVCICSKLSSYEM